MSSRFSLCTAGDLAVLWLSLCVPGLQGPLRGNLTTDSRAGGRVSVCDVMWVVILVPEVSISGQPWAFPGTLWLLLTCVHTYIHFPLPLCVHPWVCRDGCWAESKGVTRGLVGSLSAACSLGRAVGNGLCRALGEDSPPCFSAGLLECGPRHTRESSGGEGGSGKPQAGHVAGADLQIGFLCTGALLPPVSQARLGLQILTEPSGGSRGLVQ